MKRISFAIMVLTAISFCIHSCSASSEKQKEILKEESGRVILEHCNQNNYDARADVFTSFIGVTHDIVEFRENGDVCLRLSKDNQVFDITQKQQQHRLQSLKNLLLGR